MIALALLAVAAVAVCAVVMLMMAALKMVLWLVLLPVRLLLHIILLPLLLLKALIGGVVLLVLGPVLVIVFLAGLVALATAIVVPVLPLLFIVFVVWVILRSKPASTAIVRPRSACTRFSSGALGSKPTANSLRSTICTLGLPSVSTIVSRRWPRAAARVIALPEDWVNCVLPEITEFMAPMPEISIVLILTPCFSHRFKSSAR